MLRFRFALVLASAAGLVVASAGSVPAEPRGKQPAHKRDGGPKDGKAGKDAPAGKQGEDGKANKDGKGDVVGTRWSYTAVAVAPEGGDGPRIESGTYRTSDYAVFKGGNKVGTYVRTGATSLRLHIHDGKLAGHVNLTQTRTGPAVYRGEWRTKDGGTARITVTVHDR